MNRKSQIVNICLFAGIIGTAFAFNILKSDQVFSANENRNLAQNPEFTFTKLFKDQYTSEFEKYVTDQFIFRDQWVEGKTLVERLLGKVENNGVYFGKNQRLMERLASVNVDQINKNIKYVNQFVNGLDEDVKVNMMLIPGSVAIMKEDLPRVSDDIDQLSLIDQIEANMSSRIEFTNVNQVFLEHNQEDLYFKTDHHFNLNGSKLAYEALAKQLGFPLHTYQRELVAEGFLGTLGSQSGAYYNEHDEIYQLINDEQIDVYYPDLELHDNNVYAEDNLLVKDKYTYYLNGNHSQVKITTNHQEKEKLLIIRDSYANIFTPYLLEDFSEITLLDLRYYKSPISEFIRENEIDRVLFFYSGKNFMSDVNFTFLK